MMYLTQNRKMKAIEDGLVYNWGLPAFRSRSGFKTCPKAKLCVSGCYARSGGYLFKHTVNKYEQRLALSQSPNFIKTLCEEIDIIRARAKKKGKQSYIRIHDSGDFYSPGYLNRWLSIIKAFPDVVFYAYTKEIALFKAQQLPQNFKVIYSFGGKEDYLIDIAKDRHAIVFEDRESLLKAGYEDASKNDLKALGANNKIGLIFHHNKKYINTLWSKVTINLGENK